MCMTMYIYICNNVCICAYVCVCMYNFIYSLLTIHSLLTTSPYYTHTHPILSNTVDISQSPHHANTHVYKHQS